MIRHVSLHTQPESLHVRGTAHGVSSPSKRLVNGKKQGCKDSYDDYGGGYLQKRKAFSPSLRLSQGRQTVVPKACEPFLAGTVCRVYQHIVRTLHPRADKTTRDAAVFSESTPHLNTIPWQNGRHNTIAIPGRHNHEWRRFVGLRARASPDGATATATPAASGTARRTARGRTTLVSRVWQYLYDPHLIVAPSIWGRDWV